MGGPSVPWRVKRISVCGRGNICEVKSNQIKLDRRCGKGQWTGIGAGERGRVKASERKGGNLVYIFVY